MDQGDYLREAQRCQELAATAPNSETASRWHRLADDYTILAEVVDARIHHRPAMLRMPQRAQQQSKARKQSS